MSKTSTTHAARLVLVVALMLATLAPELNAQPQKAGPKRTLKILQDFKDELREVDQLLLAGADKKAYRRSSLLIRRMSDTFISGPAIGRYLGIATSEPRPTIQGGIFLPERALPTFTECRPSGSGREGRGA
jgi:hypothetical protein